MTSTAHPLERGSLPPSVRTFLVQALFWNVVLFGLVRLAWVDAHLVGALVEFQKAIVYWYGTTPHPGVVVTSSCSGADVMALCAGTILAYPAPARRRLSGLVLGIGLILAANAVRIASLHAAASTPATMQVLHEFVWPTVLTIGVATYVALWIRRAEQARATPHWMLFARALVVALVGYAALAPWVLSSASLLVVGQWTASAAGVVLTTVGATVTVAGNVLVTGRGAYMVTQECVFTPLVPLYLAGVVTLPMAGRRRALWLAAALPLFATLGVARLLVLALPASLAATPDVLAHGFYQMVTALVCLIAAAHIGDARDTGGAASRRTMGALAWAAGAGLIASVTWTPALQHASGLAWPPGVTLQPGDPQGALALLPTFQVGLLAGLWFALRGGGRRAILAVALGILAVSQVGGLALLGWLATALGVEPHALAIRAWALGLPLALAPAFLPIRGTRAGDPAYTSFWDSVGESFPSLTGAASTAHYREGEQRLIRGALPALAGQLLLKTDLWDEAKNTHILQWTADQGADTYGVDIAPPTVRAARAAFGHRRLRSAVSDVRRLPFANASFDAIYSMGTVEHFDETEEAVAELARVLRPGGRLVLGVPNRYDPFLRPVLVAVLHRCGLYAYGYEKSYSRRQLRHLVEQSGLRVEFESGLLFVPGWLRMLDLWCHTRMPALTAVTGACIQPFAWLERRVPLVRRHGYLIAAVGVKPGAAGPDSAVRCDEVPHVAQAGTMHVVDAHGCNPETLRSVDMLQRLFDELAGDLHLHAVAPPVWHVFPGHAGVTGMVLLSESHLTIHTYPESARAAIDLYCCRPSLTWAWEQRLRQHLGATDVRVRVLTRE